MDMLVFLMILNMLTTINVSGQQIAIPSAEENDYRLGPGDVVKISVDSVPEISEVYTITESGEIIFPTLLSPLNVKGMTVKQLQGALVKLLEEYMYSPKVTVRITEYHSHKVLVLGPFQKPGKYELKGETVPLLDVITEAGGLREIKEGDELVILRNSLSLYERGDNAGLDPVSEIAQPIRVDLQKLLREGDMTQNVMIQSGDVIYLASFFAAERYVYVAAGGQRGAGAIPYEYGLTAFKAIMRAGVMPENPQSVDLLVIRRQGNGEQFINAQLKFDPMNPNLGDVALQPDDIVILPSQTSRVVYVAGEVNRPGTIPFQENLTVLQAILDAGGMTKKAVGNRVKILREDANGRKQIPIDMNAILERADKSQNITLIPGDIILVSGMSLEDDIMITGKVNTPGIVPYEEGLTVTKAIFMVGGLSNNELKSQIRIMSRNGEIYPPFLLDISKVQAEGSNPAESSSNPTLKPGDLVVVLGPSPTNIVSVVGEVLRPGIIDYEEGMTVLQAVLKAGGFSRGAARSKVRIVRGEGEKQQNIRVDLGNLTDKDNRSRDTLLLPGDIVYVPEAFF